MKEIGMAIVFGLCVLLGDGQAAASTIPLQVMQWAPVIYQQTSHENVFTVVNFDHDWRANNNSENLSYYPPPMASYYSFVESADAYFIGYYFYYPRHLGFDRHEHDMTGILLAVRKTSTGAGQLSLLLTYSNKEMRRWDVAKPGFYSGHLMIAISSGTHELSVIKQNHVLAARAIYPLAIGDAAHSAARVQGEDWHYDGYQLADLKELWDRRNDIGMGRIFGRAGFFDSYDTSNVALPWMWKSDKYKWLSQPAELMQCYLGGVEKSAVYLSNPYMPQ